MNHMIIQVREGLGESLVHTPVPCRVSCKGRPGVSGLCLARSPRMGMAQPCWEPVQMQISPHSETIFLYIHCKMLLFQFMPTKLSKSAQQHKTEKNWDLQPGQPCNSYLARKDPFPHVPHLLSHGPRNFCQDCLSNWSERWKSWKYPVSHKQQISIILVS